MLLPRELFGIVFSVLNVKDVLNFSQTCKQILYETSRPDFGYLVHQFVDATKVFEFSTKQDGYLNTTVAKRRRYNMGVITAVIIDDLYQLKQLSQCPLIKKIYFHDHFNEIMHNEIEFPPKLTHILFGYHFNQSINEVNFPHSLRFLSFSHDYKIKQMVGSCFNRSVDSLRLPPHLTHLIFGSSFNQSLHRMHLPNSVQYLEFGSSFNQPMDNITLPESLRTLIFGAMFNQSLHPLNLHNLKLLEHLSVGSLFQQSVDNLKLPCSLRHFHMYSCTHISLTKIKLPILLTHLTICGVNVNDEVEKIIAGLKSLTNLGFSGIFNTPIGRIHFPSQITHLRLDDIHFNQPVDNLKLPESLTHLTFGYSFNQPADHLKLPDSLTHLTFGFSFNQPVNNLKLPNSITHLTFGYMFQQPITNLQVPSSLIDLTLLRSKKYM